MSTRPTSAEAIITLGGRGIARIMAHVCVPHLQATAWGVLIFRGHDELPPLSPKSVQEQAKSAQAVLINIKPQRQAGQTVSTVSQFRVYAKNVTLHICLSERPYAPYCPTARLAASQFVRNTQRPIALPWPA